MIVTKLKRISSHLVWIGTHALDLAAMSMFMYSFREREQILDILELISGQRMMTTYIRPGGVWRDVPVEFEGAVRDFIKIFPKRLDEYEALLTKNPFLLDRLLGIGTMSKETALSYGVTGPILRASGVDWESCARSGLTWAMNSTISTSRCGPKATTTLAILSASRR